MDTKYRNRHSLLMSPETKTILDQVFVDTHIPRCEIVKQLLTFATRSDKEFLLMCLNVLDYDPKSVKP